MSDDDPTEEEMRDALERFEIDAAAFYKETGMMAPGKDLPAAMGAGDDRRARHKAWGEWLERRYAKIH